MSRSYKKNPVHGIAGDVSEKKDKAAAHQARRAHFRTSLGSAADLDAFMFEERNEAHSNIWCHAKDGKTRAPVNVRLEGRAMHVLHKPRWLASERDVHKLLGK